MNNPMKRCLSVLTSLLLQLALGVAALTFVSQASAQTCAPTRVLNQHFCRSSGGSVCTHWENRCSGDPGGNLVGRCNNSSDCQGTGHGDLGVCQPYCTATNSGGSTCSAESMNATCSSAPDCRANVSVATCRQSGTSCSESNEVLNYECWINGSGGGGGGSGGGDGSGGSDGGVSCTQVCMPSAANCGAYARSAGVGSCTGSDICCGGTISGPPPRTCQFYPDRFYPSRPLYLLPNNAWRPTRWYLGGGGGGLPAEIRFVSQSSGVARFQRSSISNVSSEAQYDAQGRRYYQVNVRGESEGTTTLTANAYWNGRVICTMSVNAIVQNGTLTITPNPINVSVGYESVLATATVTTADGSNVNKVDFHVNNDELAVAAPGSDTESPYETNVISGTTTGRTRLVGRATTDSGDVLQGSVIVNVGQTECEQPEVNATTSVCPTSSTSTDGELTFTWNQGLLANEYMVRVWRDNTVSGATRIIDTGWRPKTWANFTCDDAAQTCSYTLRNRASNIGPFIVRVWARNSGVCTQSEPGELSSVSMSCGFNVGGNPVSLDNEGESYVDSNGFCQIASPTTSVQPGAGSEVQDSTETYVSSVNADGTFVPLNMPPNGTGYLVKLDITDPNYSCTCPNPDCSYTINVGPEVTQLNYFVTATREPWFQLIGGDLHINNSNNVGQAFVNPVPFTCKMDLDAGGDCQPYTIARANPSIPGTSGILTYGGGVVDTWGQAGNQINRVSGDDIDTDSDGEPDVARLAQTQIDLPGQNFEYFIRLHEFGLNPAGSDDFNGDPGETLWSNAGKPVNPPSGGKPAYYRQGNLVINSPWTLASGENIVIFVNGSLDINATISAPPGSFLAFVVSGNITIDANLGDSDPNDGIDTVLEGVYIADGSITVQSQGGSTTDLAANFEGTYVGWNGLVIDRDYRSSLNNTNPIVTFEYRPDYLVNAPDTFRTSYFRWRQVAP